MLEPRTKGAIAHLVTSMLAVKPLVEGMAVPVRVVPLARGAAGNCSAVRWDTATGLLDRVARCTRVTGLTLARDATPHDLDVFERAISDRLALAELAAELTDVPVSADLLAEVDRVAAEAVAGSFDVVFAKETITASDGVPLNVYCAGPRGEAVVLVPACGMPAALTESWMRFLARDRRVMTWESRGLFSAAGHPGDYAIDLTSQAEDLFTVMDHYGVSCAHVIGLCGGAMIALAAAAGRPDRIASLSLWHGAYAFADGCPRTRHQHDLIELMAIAAHSRAAARSVQGTLCRMALTGTPAEVAQFVLYPYASPELFYRYCRLNGSLTSTDVRQYLSRVTQPTLVVTSRDDVTAHPQGSRQVADGLPNARLRIEPRGDHIALFRADNTLMRVAADFIAEVSSFPVTARHTRLWIASGNAGTHHRDEVAMHGYAQDIDRRWFKQFGRTDDTARIRLLCFHHAGGSAAMYRQWPRLMPPSVEPVAVHLPGRADRFTEPPHDRMTSLVSDLVEVIAPLLDRPYACYGISMGARVALALVHALRERAMPLPTRLYVACDPAPVTDDGTWPWQGRPDGLEGYLREMGGTPPEVLDHPELLRAVLPALRADLSVLSTNDFRPGTPLELPIVAFAGVDDPIGTPELMDRWRTETSAGFELHRLPGGHFLNAGAETRVIRTILRDLL